MQFLDIFGKNWPLLGLQIEKMGKNRLIFVAVFTIDNLNSARDQKSLSTPFVDNSEFGFIEISAIKNLNLLSVPSNINISYINEGYDNVKDIFKVRRGLFVITKFD
jgi:hypothetical protein